MNSLSARSWCADVFAFGRDMDLGPASRISVTRWMGSGPAKQCQQSSSYE